MTRPVKTLQIKFNFTIDVVADARYDTEWIADKFLNSDRFSTLTYSGDPGVITCASCGVEGIRQILPAQQ